MAIDVLILSEGGVELAGVLAMPLTPGAVAGVVLVGGSGPSNRDNDGFFVPLREHLRRRGIAVLSYDKRGVGGSTGRWDTATVDDLAADASAALTFLRRQSRVDSRRTSLFGHSEGGWVALRASLRAEPPSRLVLNSCPGVPFLDAEMFALKVAGLPQDDFATMSVLLRQLAEIARAGHGVHAGRDHLAAARRQSWSDPRAVTDLELTAVLWSQLEVWGLYDPTPDLARCPVATIALFGAEDPLVPVSASIQNYARTALRQGRDHASRVFDGAGHRMALARGTETVPGYLEYLTRALTLADDP